jgi:hypothetical protein
MHKIVENCAFQIFANFFCSKNDQTSQYSLSLFISFSLSLSFSFYNFLSLSLSLFLSHSFSLSFSLSLTVEEGIQTHGQTLSERMSPGPSFQLSKWLHAYHANKVSSLVCPWQKVQTCSKRSCKREFLLKGKYNCTVDVLFDWFGISCMTTDNCCFYLQNRLIQTSQTGGQWYSDPSPFSIPCFNF